MMLSFHWRQNFKEVQAVLKIAERYQKQNKEYRIITPYDGQRNALEKALKSTKLSWEDKCFCVDSFQGERLSLRKCSLAYFENRTGNEEDHIIISLVRTEKQGFLRDVRRTNVMLTRCKKSMIICTNRNFLTTVARDTLVGKLVATGKHAWLNWSDILSNRF
jgi:superfamily I DNA and/or RNA helicase